MVDTQKFYDYLVANQMDFFVGVPDSLLKNLCSCITENSSKKQNIITANEGNAIAMASGYHVASGKYGVVYMQNSGIGNTVNPLLSLVDKDVYKIPMLLIIGWRGEPGVKDEPQHKMQGKVTLGLLEAMNVKYMVLEDDYEKQVDECVKYMKEENQPVALVVRKDTFASYRGVKTTSDYLLTREESLEIILSNLGDDDYVVSTTGKTSREIFELREMKNEGHGNDFLTVGSMGHTASIALGMSIGTDKKIYTIDGDGSFLMHMGGFPIICSVADENFKYILINNGSHESVGGQPTVAFDIDVEGILTASGFKNVYSAKTVDEIEQGMKKLNNEKLSALVIYTKQGSRDDLGRPKTTPEENKLDMMRKISK